MSEYSGGMQRRVDLASALIHLPPVLFLDEPTEGLDPHGRAAIWETLEGLKEALGMTVVLTTHYMEEADRLCDRIAIVDRGQIVARGTPAELKAGTRATGQRSRSRSHTCIRRAGRWSWRHEPLDLAADPPDADPVPAQPMVLGFSVAPVLMMFLVFGALFESVKDSLASRPTTTSSTSHPPRC